MCATARIIGGETAIWTEQTGTGDILQRVFPRTWAYAERLWTNPESGKPIRTRYLGHVTGYQPIIARYLGHVTGYQPIREQ